MRYLWFSQRCILESDTVILAISQRFESRVLRNVGKYQTSHRLIPKYTAQQTSHFAILIKHSQQPCRRSPDRITAHSLRTRFTFCYTASACFHTMNRNTHTHTHITMQYTRRPTCITKYLGHLFPTCRPQDHS
jgi:hypothetical protein